MQKCTGLKKLSNFEHDETRAILYLIEIQSMLINAKRRSPCATLTIDIVLNTSQSSCSDGKTDLFISNPEHRSGSTITFRDGG